MNKILKITLISSISIIGIFAAVMIIHIAMMVGNKPTSAFYQMARVDFSSGISDATMQNIKTDLAANKGFVRSYYNNKAHTFVYTFDSRYTNADELYTNAINKNEQNNNRFVITEEMKGKGCPVGADNKLYASLTTAITSLMY